MVNMIRDVWKKFDETDLGHSAVHHLLAVHTLSSERGYARATDVASYLQLSRASISITMRKLKDKGYITEDQNKFLLLTEDGNNVVQAVLSKRHLMEFFFANILGVTSETAEADACKVEHLITDETSAKLRSFIGLYLSEEKVASNFRAAFEQHVHHCGDQACSFCVESCYFAGKEELFARS